MRPQHDDHDGRPSPQSQTASPFAGRVRQDRPEGKSGRHRLDPTASKRAARELPAAREPLALPAAPAPMPSAGSKPGPMAGRPEIAWHDLVSPANLPVPVEPALPALTADDLPAAPQELSLARRDSVVPRQATSRTADSWAFSPWGTPPAYDPADVWDSTEEHDFSWGLTDPAPKQAAPRPAAPLAEIAPAIFVPPPLDKSELPQAAEKYLSPAGPLTPGLAPVRRLRAAKVARYAALGLIALLGVAAAISQPNGPDGNLTNTSQSILDRSNAAAADRSENRAATPTQSAAAKASAAAKPKATPSKKPSPKATTTALPLVAGFDKAQMTNARTIIQTGQKLGIPQRGLLISLMTAMQESDLYNQASAAVPESFDYPHQGDSVDYDSCGLFQQRTSMGWGTVKQIMDPVYSSTKFFKSLVQVDGWQNMELTLAAQAVQGSAFPYAYAQHESRARAVLGALT